MEKYTMPKIPTSQHILEDLAEIGAVQLNSKPSKFIEDNEGVQKAHACYLNVQHLQKDLEKQDVLNSKLDELNKQLVESIANLRK